MGKFIEEFYGNIDPQAGMKHQAKQSRAKANGSADAQ